MKSRVHPRFKTKYRVGNWPEYDRGLVQRGDITLWISTDATDAWTPGPSGRRGGHLRRALEQFEAHYHAERNHQGLGNELIEGTTAANHGEVVCRERLGGLLNFYHRAA